jgi:hypothetical protein
MRNPLCPKARSEDLVVQSLIHETLVFDLITNEAHCLNETASFVWNSCNGDIPLEEIARSVAKEFGQPVSVDFVNFAVSQLYDRNLLAKDGFSVPVVSSRREAIKRLDGHQQ